MRDTTRTLGSAARAALLLLVCLVPATASAIVVSVHDIAVSGGAVYGNAVVVPAGETVTVDIRVGDPTASYLQGLGLSYYGYDAALIEFVDGLAVPTLFQDCFAIPSAGEICPDPGLPNYAGVGYVGDNRQLEETAVFPGGPLAGTPRVRGLFLWRHVNGVTAYDGSINGDKGLDGVSDGGDAHVRVTFEAIADGYTSITIGTGDDLGGFVMNDLSVPGSATNAEVRIAAPEPGFASGLAWAGGVLASLGAVSRRSGAGPIRRS